MGFLILVIVIVVIAVIVSKGKGNVISNNTLVLNDVNADPSLKKQSIEWKDGEIFVHTKYLKTNEEHTTKLNGTYKIEGDQLVVYANSNFLGSQGVDVKIGWVDSDNRIYLSNKELVPYHNSYLKEFLDEERVQVGYSEDFYAKQLEQKQTKINEQAVAFVDSNNHTIKAENGAVIAKYNGSPLEAGGAVIALFFEGWTPLDRDYKDFCRFWISEFCR